MATSLASIPPIFFAGCGDARIFRGGGRRNPRARARKWLPDSRVRPTGADFGPIAPQPRGLAVSDDVHVFVAEAAHLEVLKTGQEVCAIDAAYRPTCVDVANDFVAVGGEDAKVHLYTSSSNGTLADAGVLEGSNKTPVSAQAFTPDGRLLAAGDSTRKFTVYEERKLLISHWTFHSERINSLSWTSDCIRLASGSLDTNVYIWSVVKLMKNIAIINAIPGGVWGVHWISGGDTGKAKLMVRGQMEVSEPGMLYFMCERQEFICI